MSPALDAAMLSVEQTADPQTEATSRVVAWVTVGAGGEDFAMLRRSAGFAPADRRKISMLPGTGEMIKFIEIGTLIALLAGLVIWFSVGEPEHCQSNPLPFVPTCPATLTGK